MRITFNNWFRIVLVLVLSLLLVTSMAFAKNKNVSGANSNNLAKPSAADDIVIAIGAVQNYFTSSTFTPTGGTDEQTFMIGDDGAYDPSMVWLEGGYAENHYLYFGMCRMATQNNEVRFSTLDTDDWVVYWNDPEAVAPAIVTFTLNDNVVSATLKKGITARQTVYAWSESYRDDFYILEYDITNTSTNTYNDFYVFQQHDCDISTASGGSGSLAWSRDDVPSYYLGTDEDGNPEHISYMWDGDNPDIAGDDTGGNRTPKEALGFIGSRILESPPIVGDTDSSTANTQSGHQWWDWNSDPQLGGDYYNLCKLMEMKTDPGSPHDYRYMQITGPFELAPSQTIKVVFAYGIGEGLDGLRANLQWAYKLYWNDWQGPAAPQAPNMTLVSGQGFATVTWDSVSEHSRDPLTGEQDFQGYRLYRSFDRAQWTLLAEYDRVDKIGANTGLPVFNPDGLYEYTDTDVTDGFLYYYTVTAFDNGSADLPSLETGKSVEYSTQPGPGNTGSEVDEGKIRVVPNPFVVKAPWDFMPTKDNPAEERIQFQNIPDDAKITVFTLTGDMVIELHQQGDQGWIDWDLITRNRQKIVSGLYLYVVEPPAGDNFIGKFVVIR